MFHWTRLHLRVWKRLKGTDVAWCRFYLIKCYKEKQKRGEKSKPVRNLGNSKWANLGKCLSRGYLQRETKMTSRECFFCHWCPTGEDSLLLFRIHFIITLEGCPTFHFFKNDFRVGTQTLIKIPAGDLTLLYSILKLNNNKKFFDFKYNNFPRRCQVWPQPIVSPKPFYLPMRLPIIIKDQ